jgi:hypothetical protein
LHHIGHIFDRVKDREETRARWDTNPIEASSMSWMTYSSSLPGDDGIGVQPIVTTSVARRIGLRKMYEARQQLVATASATNSTITSMSSGIGPRKRKLVYPEGVDYGINTDNNNSSGRGRGRGRGRGAGGGRKRGRGASTIAAPLVTNGGVTSPLHGILDLTSSSTNTSVPISVPITEATATMSTTTAETAMVSPSVGDTPLLVTSVVTSPSSSSAIPPTTTIPVGSIPSSFPSLPSLPLPLPTFSTSVKRGRGRPRKQPSTYQSSIYANITPHNAVHNVITPSLLNDDRDMVHYPSTQLSSQPHHHQVGVLTNGYALPSPPSLGHVQPSIRPSVPMVSPTSQLSSSSSPSSSSRPPTSPSLMSTASQLMKNALTIAQRLVGKSSQSSQLNNPSVRTPSISTSMSGNSSHFTPIPPLSHVPVTSPMPLSSPPSTSRLHVVSPSSCNKPQY